MSIISTEKLATRCHALGARMNVAVVSFQMRPVNIDSDGASRGVSSEARRDDMIAARYQEMETAEKAEWREKFALELEAVCDLLAQAGVAPPLPPAEWGVLSMREISTTLNAIKL